MIRPWTLITVALLLGAALTIFIPATSGAGNGSGTTLYERIGGLKTIAPMMDDLIDRLYLNPTINANPAVQEIHLRLHPSVAKFMFTEYFCQATGGPCVYVGRSMKETHAGLGIKESEWKAMEEEFSKTLEKFNIPEREQKELISLVDYVKSDVVASP